MEWKEKGESATVVAQDKLNILETCLDYETHFLYKNITDTWLALRIPELLEIEIYYLKLL